MDEDEAHIQVTSLDSDIVSTLVPRLKAAVHYTVGKLCESIAAEYDQPISRDAVAAIAETTFRQCDIFAKDLEAFARHAKRQTVNVEDVKLLARRSTALSNYIQQKSEELAANNQEQREKKKNAAKKKSKSLEENEAEEEEGATEN